MEIKTKIKKAMVTCLAVGLCYLPLAKQARAKIDGNVGYIHSENSEKSHIEANAFYKLPFDINGYTFMDFNKDKKGYFGKTSLDKTLNPYVNPRAQIVHMNDIYSQGGIGLSGDIPTPKDITAKIRFMPLWYDHREQLDKSMLGFYFNMNLPKNFGLKSYGEWNLKKDCEWDYGEIEVSKKIGSAKIAYLPTLINRKGRSTPRVEHRACVRFGF